MPRSKSRPQRTSIDLTKSTRASSPRTEENDAPPELHVLDKKRRSGRQRTSRVMHVDGHAVLVANNYTVTAETYEHGTYDNEVDENDYVPKKKLKKTKRALVPKIKHVSKAEIMRQQHNDAVKQRIAVHDVNRRQFFAQNVDIIAPFVDSGTEEYLRNNRRYVVSDVEITEQPKMLKGSMREYQLAGLNWMVNMHRKGMPMILGDEMGLGKTFQTISLLSYMKETEGRSGPSLVICPLSVIYSWCSEISKWAPGLNFLRFHGSDVDERMELKKSIIENPNRFDVIVTTYDMTSRPDMQSLWSRIYFNYVVLDEGHIIKNHQTQISQAVRRLHYESTLILTGTPLQNNLVDLWSMLDYLYNPYFQKSLPLFADSFDLGNNKIDPGVLRQAHKMLELFMLRRLKVEVEKLLPKKIETKVICPLSAMQIHWYKGILLKDLKALVAGQKGGKVAYSVLSNMIMQLRKTCCHPFLFDGAESSINSTAVEDLVSASGKLAVTDLLLRELYKKEHRVIFFSQFTRVLDIFEDYCIMRGWRYGRLDGSVPRAERNFIVKAFNAPDSDLFILMMSTRAGGMGLNLQTADTCILYDSDWNPQSDIQAMGRVHRIGQTKTVHVYRLVCSGTIEERMIERAEKKLYLDQMVNRGKKNGVDDGGIKNLSTADLLETLRFGSNAVFGESANELNTLPTEDEIAFLIDRTRKENDSSGKLKGGKAKIASTFDVQRDLSSARQLHGVNFERVQEQSEIESKSRPTALRQLADHWQNDLATMRGKRKKKSRIMMVASKGSGYGSTAVPVLSANNYDLNIGESSVFARELNGRSNCVFAAAPKKSSRQSFLNMSECQICGEGGTLFMCPRCPVSVHAECMGYNQRVGKFTREMFEKSFVSCTHHHCSDCLKNRSHAGGLVYPCQSCANSYCEDCLPPEARFLEPGHRFEDEFGFNCHHAGHRYIHCSEQCEVYAIKEFGWKPPPSLKDRVRVYPPALDIGWAFSGANKDGAEDGIVAVSNEKNGDSVDDQVVRPVADIIVID